LPVPKVKICCISNKDEARTVIQFGASALGLVARMPSGPGVISDELIKEIATIVPPPIATFLLTSETEADAIIAHQKKVGTNTIQLVDEVEIKSYEKIKSSLPGIKIVQVIHVTGEEAIHKAIEVAEHVDAILLDSGNPNLKIKELGGTGRVHNWEISRKICESISIPIFLAGGLNPENITEAVKTVQPFGVDICSGVRKDGKLNEELLSRFFTAINNLN